MPKRTHQEETFNTQIGSKATVQRTTMGAEAAAGPNRALAEVGVSCHPLPETNTRYMGSAAVHIFWHDELKQIFFVSQTQPLELYRCPEILAKKGIDDLIQTVKELYGHKRSRLRSGF